MIQFSLKTKLIIAASAIVLSVGGYFLYQYKTGQAAKIEVKRIEKSVEVLDDLNTNLDVIREQDFIAREVIRAVPERPGSLTQQEQDAFREIFK
tara:strand:- start:11261 stop:11542 length:282 start_codon:yes stop_codon:yes gene_type:complete